MARKLFLVRLLTSLLVVSCVVLSCSKQDTASKFNSSLTRIDTYIHSGQTDKDFTSLSRLRKLAVSSGQWLSLVKRERLLGAKSEIVKTLNAALVKIPSSPELTAVLVNTFADMGDFEGAHKYAAALVGTQYALQSSYSEITLATTTHNPFEIDPRLWVTAAEYTNIRAFLLDAITVYAMNGNLAAACEIAKRYARPTGFGENLFFATLYYDAGLYDEVFRILPVSEASLFNSERLAIMADAAWKQRNQALAGSLWSIWAEAQDSPLPIYNLAAISGSSIQEKGILERGLSKFPTYYPAVVRYVRSVVEPDTKEKDDPITNTLAVVGFRSLEMEAELLSKPVTKSEARAVLEHALKLSGTSPDIRFNIEQIRMDWHENSDAVKTTSSIWRLIESNRQNTILHSYAVWYFLSLGDYDTCFSLNKKTAADSDSFYSGLESSMAGDLTRAEELLGKVAQSDANAWCALANIARIKEKRQDFEGAIEDYSLATTLQTDTIISSALQYEVARLLVELRYTEKAIYTLDYSLELNPSNYKSRMLLKKLNAAR